MPGLVPGIHVLAAKEVVDGRDKPGHNETSTAEPSPAEPRIGPAFDLRRSHDLLRLMWIERARAGGPAFPPAWCFAGTRSSSTVVKTTRCL